MEERRGFIRMLITVAVVALAVGAARAADDTTGKVTIESISAAAGLGFTWGTGVLEYRGQQYPSIFPSQWTQWTKRATFPVGPSQGLHLLPL